MNVGHVNLIGLALCKDADTTKDTTGKTNQLLHGGGLQYRFKN